ncbi:hypothetical protein EJ06DRAFT_345411 [Trichodelitschia bisporula]|uniref:DUF7371 domain-containing protein n=1 Tax=Trichodelitschia bisporula TaxID=703511 RepID=A0A6G1I3K0_9PEZI|nr:hypothetical protein EJ06DRAFT_345411 [Trichodelitschia bisporula]
MKTKDSIPTGSFPTYTPVHGMGVFPSAAGASAPTGSSGTVGSFSAATGTTRPKASTLRITVNAASRSVGTAAIFSTATHKSTTTASIDACGADGERGNFTLTWDDEPLLVSKPNEVDFTPVFNPYHHMFFSNGYAYVPPPGEPFDAASAPNLAIFLPNASRTDVGSADGPAVQPGEIGAGPRANSKYFHFGAFSAEMGCDHSGLDFCQMMITGYGWEGGKQVVKVRQEVDIPPCDTMPHCKLSHIGFRQDFRDLSGIQFEAFINGTQRIFVMDNLQLQWTDNSCEAGTYRTSHRK